MTAPQPLPAEVRALMLRTLIGEAERELAVLTKDIGRAYPLPTTVPFESPLDGARLGTVARQRVAPDWKVVSPEQLVEHITTEYPAVLETVYLLDVPGVDEPVALPEDHPLTAALAEHAPDLLTALRRVPQHVIDDAVQESRDTGRAAAPGIQLVRARQGNLVFTYDKKEALGAIVRMMRAGMAHLPWDVTPELAPPVAAEPTREAS